MDKVIKVNDPVGAISIHGCGGILGTLLGGLLSVEQGLLYGNGVGCFLAQVIGVVSVGAFCIEPSATFNSARDSVRLSLPGFYIIYNQNINTNLVDFHNKICLVTYP